MRMKQNQGFSLVEVLVALVVVSVGMLGIAGLYVNGMQAGRTATFSHHAVTLAGDVADRIRANPRAGAAYVGDPGDNNCIDKGVDCSPAEMAAHDIFIWDAQADESLPSGAVGIQFNAGATPPEYTITVTWDEPGVNNPSYSIIIPVLGI